MGTKSEEVPAECPSATEQQIIRQIEYYFGNYNLSRDKFLREQLKVDDGWVPLETMIKFNRLKKLSEDFNVIIEALKKSPKQLMEISEDCTKIRRRTAAPVPEEYGKRGEDFEKRTLYMKGFRKNSTLDELLEYFKDHHVEHVYMKRLPNPNKPFKGSCFVTFETREDAEKFYETKGLKYCGTDLLKEWKVDYTKRKDELFERLKAEKEKKLLKRAGMIKEGKENGDEKIPEIVMVPDCLLKLSGLSEDSIREHIKDVFEVDSGLDYVDYSKGKPFAILRFESGEARNSALKKVVGDDNKVTIGSVESTVSLIEGEEEKEYWKNIAICKAQARERNRDNRNFHGRKNFKRWGGNRSRGKRSDNNKDDESAEPPSKKTKRDASESNENESDDHSAKKTKRDSSENEDKSDEPPQKKLKGASEENETKPAAVEVATEVKSES